MALAEFAGVLAGLIKEASPPGDAYPFPTSTTLQAGLSQATAAQVIKKHLDDYVVVHQGAIPPSPVPGVPGGTAVGWDTAAQISKVTGKASAVGFTPLPFSTNLPKEATTKLFDYKLNRLYIADDIVEGFNLATTYASTHTVPASAYTTTAVAARTLLNLAAFDGFCIRLGSAIKVADRAQVSLAEVLALWRTEGDLISPYSEKRRLDNAPAGDLVQGVHLATPQRVAEVMYSMRQGLWSSRYSAIFPGEKIPSAANRDTKQDEARIKAFVEWSVITAGVDYFWQVVNDSLLKGRGYINSLAVFFNDNHKARFGNAGDNLALRQLECADVIDSLAVSDVMAVDDRVFVAPTEGGTGTVPYKLIWIPLTEALIFFSLDNKAGNGPVIPPSPKLKYLAYHCQDHRHATDVEKDKFSLMVVAAAASARSNATSAALRSSLQAVQGVPAPGQLRKLWFNADGVVAGNTAPYKTAYDALTAANWWVDANLDLLADFIVTATLPAGDRWRNWDVLSANAARYMNLLAYYKTLLA